MSILNTLYDKFCTYSTTPHLDHLGNLKGHEHFSREIKECQEKLHEEHKKFHHAEKISYSELVFNNMGDAVDGLVSLNLPKALNHSAFSIGYLASGVVSMLVPLPSQLTYDDYFSLPIPHLDDKGKVKATDEYRIELAAKLEEIISEHQAMIDYDNSSYIKLCFSKIGKACASTFTLQPHNTLYHGTGAAFYAAGGVASGLYQLGSSTITQSALLLEYVFLHQELPNGQTEYKHLDINVANLDLNTASVPLLGFSDYVIV